MTLEQLNVYLPYGLDKPRLGIFPKKKKKKENIMRIQKLAHKIHRSFIYNGQTRNNPNVQ